MALQFHKLAVKDIVLETADCISVSLHIPPELETVFSFIQGQNITVKSTVNGEEIRRSYSICSSPLDKELRIAIKKVTGGKFSSWAAGALKPGAVLDVLPPTGNFFTVLNAEHQKNYLAFAAGSGITPLFSIIKTTLQAEPGSRFTLFYGNKNRSSIIFKEALEALKNKFIDRFSLHHILSRDEADTPLNQGRIDAEKCSSIFSYLIDLRYCDEFFICGPAAMIDTVSALLEQRGIAKERIHTERFASPGGTSVAADSVINRPTNDQQSLVTIKADGTSMDLVLSYHGASVLNAALALGADLPFACKGGVCATCRAKLISGQVSMDNNYALEPDEINNGYILTCQSHPRSEKLIIDFDRS